MASKNAIVLKNTVPEMDMADLINGFTELLSQYKEGLAATVNLSGYTLTGSRTKLYKLAEFYITELAKKNDKRLPDTSLWNKTFGLHVTPRTEDAIADCYKAMHDIFSSYPEAPYHTLTQAGLPIYTTGANNLVLENKVNGVDIYKQKADQDNGNTSVENICIDLTVNAKKMVNMFAEKQVKEPEYTDEDDDEDEYEYEYNDYETKRQEAIDWINGFDISPIVLYRAKIEILKMLCADFYQLCKRAQSDKSISDSIAARFSENAEIKKLIETNGIEKTLGRAYNSFARYIRAIAEFEKYCELNSVKLHPNILDKLPVMPILSGEDVTDCSITEDGYIKMTMLCRLKLNGIYMLMKNKKNQPSLKAEKDFNDFAQGMKFDPKAKENLFLKFILYNFIEKKLNSPEAEVPLPFRDVDDDRARAAMNKYKVHSNDYDLIAYAVYVTEDIREQDKTYYINQKESISEETMKNTNASCNIRYFDFFETLDQKNACESKGVDVNLHFYKKEYGKTEKKIFAENAFTIAVSRQGNYLPVTIHEGISQQGSMEDLLKEYFDFVKKNSGADAKTSERIAIYNKSGEENGHQIAMIKDIFTTILTVLFLRCRTVDISDYTYMLLPRVCENIDEFVESSDEKKVVDQSGTSHYITALGKALRQSFFQENIQTVTQGLVAKGGMQKDKMNNAAKSLICELPAKYNPKITLKGKTGIIFMTTRKSDGNGYAEPSMSGHHTDGWIVGDGEILHIGVAPDFSLGDDKFSYHSASSEHELIQKMQQDGCDLIIYLMKAPYETKMSLTMTTQFLGMEKEKFTQMEQDFPEISFLPMYVGAFQARQTGGADAVIITDLERALVQCATDKARRTPTLAYIIGKKMGKSEFRSGSMYQIIENYYEEDSKTGMAVKSFLSGGTFGIRVKQALTLFHYRKNAATYRETWSGKNSPFDEEMNNLAATSITYNCKVRGSSSHTVNYSAVVARVVAITNRKSITDKGV